LRRVLIKIQPDELYHLAGQSHVGLSFEIPESTCEMTAMGTLRLLEIMRDLPAASAILSTPVRVRSSVGPSRCPKPNRLPSNP
jgi:GDPmannose 4,6-dehydratase